MLNLTTSAFVIGVGYLATIFMITCARGKNCPYVKYSFVLGKDVVDDHALRNYVIATLTVPGAVECYNNCRLNCQCISINFRTKRNKDNCELNKENRHLKPSDLHPEPDAQYYDLVVDYSVKGNPCPDCQNGCCKSLPCSSQNTVRCEELCDIKGKRFRCFCSINYMGDLCQTPVLVLRRPPVVQVGVYRYVQPPPVMVRMVMPPMHMAPAPPPQSITTTPATATPVSASTSTATTASVSS